MFFSYLRNKFADYISFYPFILPTTTYIGFMHGINKSDNKIQNIIKNTTKATSCGLAIGLIYPIGIPTFSYYYIKNNFIKNK